MKTKMINNLTTKTLTQIWNNDNFIKCYTETLLDIIKEFPKLIDVSDELLKSLFFTKYLPKAITLNYGDHNIAFYSDDKFWTNVELITYKMMLEIAYVYSSILEIDPKQLIENGFQITKTKNNHRENNSQFQRNLQDALQDEFVNFEFNDTGEVSYGNVLGILRRLIKTGIGIDIDYYSKKYSELVVMSYSMINDNERWIINEFPVNDGGGDYE